jgi:hypothetical protein
MIDEPADAKAERTRDSGILFPFHPLLAPSCDVPGGGARVLGFWDENHAGGENALLGTGSPHSTPPEGVRECIDEKLENKMRRKGGEEVMGPTHCVWIDCVSGLEMGFENRILEGGVSI